MMDINVIINHFISISSGNLQWNQFMETREVSSKHPERHHFTGTLFLTVNKYICI